MTKSFPTLLTSLSFAVLVAALAAGCRSGGRGCGNCSGPGPGSAAAPAPPLLPSTAGPAPLGGPAGANPPAATATRYGGQKTCPVMGDALGSMGAPIPVVANGETIYVCCKGCVRRVQADPDKYLAIVRAERATP